jgi:DNA polymerase epsilon subunit 1
MVNHLCSATADIRAGHWYNVRVKDGVTTVTHRPDLLQRAEPVICAFDIETTKLPLRFPNAAYDQVRGQHVTAAISMAVST